MQLTFIIFIGIGGFLGAISRFLISAEVVRVFGESLPYGTLAVNIIGSFIIGFLAIYFEQHLNPEYRALFITGFLGALTTFSSFSLETTLLIEQHLYIKAALHIFLNVSLTISATIFGMMLYRRYIY